MKRNKMIKTKLIRQTFILLLCLFSYTTYLFSALVTTSRLSNNDGLSNSSVNTIFQDSENILWFGTWDGLNRYDGTAFKQYRPVPGNNRSLSNQIIRNIFEEDTRHLWIATDYGINRFDKLTGTFTRYLLGYGDKYIFRENSFQGCIRADGTVIASAYNSGLFIYNKEKEDFQSLPAVTKYPVGNITDLFFDEKGYLWLQNDKHELYRFELRPAGRSFALLLKNKFALPADVKKVFYDQDKNIWFADNDRLRFIDIYAATPRILSSDIYIGGTLNCVLKKEETLYIGTTTSLLTVKNGQIVRHSDEEVSFLSVYKGTQDIVWIGTDGKGVFKIYARPEFMTLVNHQRMPQLSNFAVRAITKDDSGNIWTGSKGGGLSKISYLGAKGLENVRNYRIGTNFATNSVLSIRKAEGNDLWIGTDGYGLYYYSAAEDRIKQLHTTDQSKEKLIYSVYSIIQTGPQTLYLGSSGGGLIRLDIDLYGHITGIEQFRHNESDRNSISSNIVYALIDDGDSLWIGTRGGGLNRFDKQTGRFTSFKNNPDQVNSLSSNDVISLLKDQKGRIWVGTTSGLNLIEDISGRNISFKRFGEGHGLPNTNIHAIQEDSKGNIWVSTSNGLARIDPESLKINSFFYEDGLQDNEFSDGASYASPDRQEIYFGGINGFNLIHPNLIGTRNFMPNLLLNQILVDNIAYPLSDSYAGKKISVGYQTGSIAFTFSIPDYVDNKKCLLAYQLVREPLFGDPVPADDWVVSEQSKNIVLNKLNPGIYTLYVKYSNADQEWNPDYFKVKLQVVPPLWESWWAILLYILLTMGGIILFYYLKKYRMSMRHKLELEKREKAKKEEIHQAKLKFFTNIAHEFSNSITLIYGAIEQIFIHDEIDVKSRKQLVSIKRNAERMHGQIQQLMEFRKVETGNLTVRFEKVDVNELVKYTLDNFIDVAESKKINVVLDLDEQLPSWITDREMLEKIIFNLLSNAMKYTPAEGEIQLKLGTTSDSKLQLICTNTGKGIKPEEVPLLFNRFKVLDNFENELSQGMYTRNGIGLAMCRDLTELLGGTITAESRVNEYTSFTVLLPQGDENRIEKGTECPASLSAKEPEPIEIPEENTADSRTILVVDDQEDILRLISDVLSEDRYRILTATNGKQALTVMDSEMPDLIVCDVVMPEMDGNTLVKTLKENHETRHIPVILLSSQSDIENQIIGLQTGANLFIAKPFHPKHLKAAVKRVLGNQQIVKDFAASPQAYKEKYNTQLIQRDDKLFIDRIVDLLQVNAADENYNQDALAEDLLISRVQLYRKIKQITQKTPGDFIRSFRLTQAERLLIGTDKTVQEIMGECGFRNKAYFYREFAKLHQCSPKDFRKQAQMQG